jgi:hypothetical protein
MRLKNGGASIGMSEKNCRWRPVGGTEFHFYEAERELKVSVCDEGGGKFLVLDGQWALDPNELPKFMETLKWCLEQVEGME